MTDAPHRRAQRVSFQTDGDAITSSQFSPGARKLPDTLKQARKPRTQSVVVGLELNMSGHRVQFADLPPSDHKESPKFHSKENYPAV